MNSNSLHDLGIELAFSRDIYLTPMVFESAAEWPADLFENWELDIIDRFFPEAQEFEVEAVSQ